MSLFQRVAGPAQPLALSGKTVLVVGGTAGVGLALASQCAAAGAVTVVLGRDEAKLARVRGDLERVAPGRIRTQLADLADLASVRRATGELNAAFERLDIVLANAGVLYLGRERRFTRDGHELTFGVNHLGTAALILGLEPTLQASPGARIVVVASEAHRRARGLPLDDLMGERGFSGSVAYSRSKLANILFARELARRWRSYGVEVHAAHPGGVDTGMLREGLRAAGVPAALYRLMRSSLLTPEEAAAGVLRVATDPALAQTTGGYFELGRPDKSSRLAADPQLAAALWDATLVLTARNERTVLELGKDVTR